MSGSGTIVRSGVAFRPERRRLYLFNDGGVLVLQAWPDLRAWKLDLSTRVWTGIQPKFDLCRFGFALEDSTGHAHRATPHLSAKPRLVGVQSQLPFATAWQGFFALIPPEPRARVSRFATGHWPLLYLESQIDGAVDIASTNPALTFALAHNGEFRRATQPWRAARRLVRKRRREILGALGFPPTDAIVRILAKIVPCSVTTQRLLWLRHALLNGDPTWVSALSHLDRINAGVLELVVDPELRQRVAPTLLREVENARGEDREPNTAIMLRALVGDPTTPENGQVPPWFRSRREVAAAYRSLKAERKAQELARRRWAKGAQPVPSTDNVVELCTSEELVAEGRRMKHCLSRKETADAYIGAIRRHEKLVYRVMEPAGTVSLLPGDGRWCVGELQGPDNTSPTEALRAAVRCWLGDDPDVHRPKDSWGDEVPF